MDQKLLGDGPKILGMDPYWCLVGNGWELRLLGLLLIVMTWIIPEKSPRLAPVRKTALGKITLNQ